MSEKTPRVAPPGVFAVFVLMLEFLTVVSLTFVQKHYSISSLRLQYSYKIFEKHLTFSLEYIIFRMYSKERRVKTIGLHKGMKLTDTPKNHSLKFRYDDETAKKLDYLTEKRQVSKADVIRKGIEIQFDNEKQ